MSLTLYELFLVLIIGQCVFLIIAIQYISKKNTGANRMIQYLLAIYSYYLLERVMIPHLGCGLFFQYGILSNSLYLVIGPFIYVYIRRLLFSQNGSYQLSYHHYLPVFVYLTYYIFHLYFYSSVQDVGRYRYIYLFCVEILFFISISAYLVRSWLLLNYYKKNERLELSFNQTITKYITVMLICLYMYMTFWLLGIFERFFFKLFIDIGMIYDISCLIFGIQIYIVGFYSLKHPEIFKIQFPAARENEAKKKNGPDPKEISAIQSLVDAFFKEEKGYRRPDLSLSILANEIDTTTNKLSWVLNNIYHKTFYELVNKYRVEDFLEKIKENKHKEFTVISIAFEVGFNSKSTFYKAFKEIKKANPTAYIKKIESSENTKAVRFE
ncbi:MAG: helix-turn-helix domain-containing protein [Bacteroidota bacterium]